MNSSARWVLTAVFGAVVVDDLRSLVADIGSQPAGELAPRALTALLYLVVVVTLAWRPRWTPWPFLLMLAVSFLLDPSPSLAALLCLLLAIAAYSVPVVGLVGMVVAAMAWFVATALTHDQQDLWLLWLLPVAFLALLPGWTLRIVVHRSAQERREAAEHDRLAREREAAIVEQTRHDRARLARELHDVVAHELTRIAMQSNLGQMSDDPQEQRESLAAISRSSRHAMSEMRRLIRVVGGDGPADVAPGQGVGSLSMSRAVDRAAAYLRAVGFEATTSLDGDESRIPLGLIPTGEVVLREATTNVVKHSAPGAVCAVRAMVTDDDLVLEVRNRLSDNVIETPASGIGLAGLRARLAEMGGTLSAEGNGEWWVLRASVPLTASD